MVVRVSKRGLEEGVTARIFWKNIFAECINEIMVHFRINERIICFRKESACI